jgi:predicted porin
MKACLTYGIVLVMNLILMDVPLLLTGQSRDTLQQQTDFLTNRLEDLTRAADRQQDYSDLTGEYLYLARHPVNINSPEAKKLLRLHLLNEMQWASLQNYIRQYGPIYSLYELKYITGFSPQTAGRLRPFVATGTPPKNKVFSWKKAFRYGSHRFLGRYGQIFEEQQGYKIPADSAFMKPGSVFLGPPQKIYWRYGFRSDDRLRFGFTAEKDAGEVFFHSRLSDTVRKMLDGVKPQFPDFFSAFAYASGIGPVKKVIIGDYHLEFGQGLCLWSGLTFGKSAETTEIRYYGNGIRPNTSANENRFFRGAAITLDVRRFSLTLFYSHNKVDGSVLYSPDSLPEVSSLQETGNHRTINELVNRHRVTVEAFGGHLSYAGRRWKTGVTWYQTRLNLPLEPGNRFYQLHYFHGKQLQNMAVNLDYNLNRLFFFGELAAGNNGAAAGTAGINFFPADRLSLTLSYRNFSPDYRVLYASPFMESGRAGNEQGLYLGVKLLLTKIFTLSAYADLYKFPWLKYQINAPSTGKAFLTQLDIAISPALSMYFRIRYGQRQENLKKPDLYIVPLTEKSLFDFRYALAYAPDNLLTLKSRIEFVRYKKGRYDESGFLAFQDVIYRFLKIPLTLNFRYALFDTGGWNSRIYAYESDVLYAFTIPPYYDKGQRIYLLVHYTFGKHFDFWIKAAHTTYFNKQMISSGPEAITGNHKTEIRVQLQAKF